MEIARRKNKSFAQYTGVDAPADPTGWGRNKKNGLKSTSARALKKRISIHSLIRPRFAVSSGLIRGLETTPPDACLDAEAMFERILMQFVNHSAA
jgi:hypothetical protein